MTCSHGKRYLQTICDVDVCGKCYEEELLETEIKKEQQKPKYKPFKDKHAKQQ